MFVAKITYFDCEISNPWKISWKYKYKFEEVFIGPEKNTYSGKKKHTSFNEKYFNIRKYKKNPASSKSRFAYLWVATLYKHIASDFVKMY